MSRKINGEIRYRPFLVTYHGPGNVRGARVGIHDLRHDKRKRVPYSYEGGDAGEQGKQYLESIGIRISARALADAKIGGKAVEVFLSEDFATELR